MPVLIFLNELSFSTATDRRVANDAMIEFIEVFRNILKYRPAISLISHIELKSLELARGYFLTQWIAAERKNLDRWRLIRAIQNTAPYSSLASAGIPDNIEYRHEGRVAEGLGYAHLLDGIGVSLAVEDSWDSPWVTIDRVIVTIDDCGEDTTKDDQVEVRHAATCANAAVHEAWLRGPRPRLPIVREGRRYYHHSFGVIIECEETHYFFSVDRAGHASSVAKRFIEYAGGLQWDADIDADGNVIENKHKGDTGVYIPKKDLNGG